MQRYFNTLSGSCGRLLMSHRFTRSGITVLEKAAYSFRVGFELPEWVSRFTHENDGREQGD